MNQYNILKDRLKVCLVYGEKSRFNYHLSNIVRALNNVDIGLETLDFHKDNLARAKDLLELIKKPKSEIVNYLGGYHSLFYITPRLFGKKMVIHWIGSNVLKVTTSKKRKLVWRIIGRVIGFHLTDFEPLADELKMIGISAAIINIIINFLLIPKIGVWGAIFSNIVAYFVWLVIYYAGGQRTLYIHYEWNRVVKFFYFSTI